MSITGVTKNFLSWLRSLLNRNKAHHRCCSWLGGVPGTRLEMYILIEIVVG